MIKYRILFHIRIFQKRPRINTYPWPYKKRNSIRPPFPCRLMRWTQYPGWSVHRCKKVGYKPVKRWNTFFKRNKNCSLSFVWWAHFLPVVIFARAGDSPPERSGGAIFFLDDGGKLMNSGGLYTVGSLLLVLVIQTKKDKSIPAFVIQIGQP